MTPLLQTIQLHASPSLRFSDIHLTRLQGAPVVFCTVGDKKDTLDENRDGCTYVRDGDRLVLRLGSEQGLLEGEIGVQLHASWTGSLGRDMNKGELSRMFYETTATDL